MLTQILGLAILGTTNVSYNVKQILGLAILGTTNVSNNVYMADPCFGNSRYHKCKLQC